jgi:hypothetical protein
MRMVLPAIILILLLAPRRVHAQSGELNFALKGGINAATLDHANRENRYGFTGGLSANFQLFTTDRRLLGGQIELLYTPRGANAVFDGVMEGRSRSHYIDLVLAGRPEARFGAISVYLLIGGGLDFLMSANKDDAAGPGQDITRDLRRIDISLLVGAGVAWRLSNKEFRLWHPRTVFVEARHDIGLFDTDLVNGGFKSRTSSLMLGLSFAFGNLPPAAASANQIVNR